MYARPACNRWPGSWSWSWRGTCRARTRAGSYCAWARGSFASRLRAATRCETTAPAWDEALRRGKESVVAALPDEAAFVRALCGRADVVLEGFRPGVAERLGIGPAELPPGVVYCSITGFGADARHAARAGHDLNYLGWAGALEDTAPAPPPLPVADLAAGALGAVAEILAALVGRERTGRGSRLVVSMTHRSHDLVGFRVGEPVPRLLTGGLACYRTYATADGRFVTVAALEPKFFARLCELLGRPELAALQYEADQESLAAELAAIFSRRPLAELLELCDGEDVCVGPVWTRAEAAAHFGSRRGVGRDVPLGAHTDAWRRELEAGEIATEPR